MIKPHGVRGEVVVELVTNRLERLEVGSELSSERGPLRVDSARAFKARWLVCFEGVGDLRAADELRGTALYADPIEDHEALWVHELVGARVETTSGERLGKVASVIANPASDLLELEGGLLVPVTFVVEHPRGRVVVEIPEGLLEAGQ